MLLLQEQKRRCMQESATTSSGGGGICPPGGTVAQPEKEADSITLTKEQVVRRLRAFGQPATLFAESAEERYLRLRRVEKETFTEDDARGGQQENSLLAISKQEKLQRKGKASGKGAGTAAQTSEKGSDASEAGTQGTKQGEKEGVNGDNTEGGGVTSVDDEDPTMAAFQRAAGIVAARKAEETMPVEDRIARYFKTWCDEWGSDLESRPDDVKGTGAGHHATVVYKQSMQYMQPLFERCKRRVLDEELKVCVGCRGRV